MNAELLVAGLWGVVVVYWLWTRRPAGDSIGSFRHELHVLEHATPTRVSPAHRLVPAGGPFEVLGAAVEQPPISAPETGPRPARDYKQAELRRRRRDVLGVLAFGVVVTLVLATLSGSVAFVGLQVVADLALVGYVALLVTTRAQTTTSTRATTRSKATTARATRARGTGERAGRLVAARAARATRATTPTEAVALWAPQAAAPWAPEVAPPWAEAAPVPRAATWAATAWDREDEVDEGPEAAIVLDGYRGAHLASGGALARLRWAPSYYEEDPEPYGDFGSYASLALAKAN